MIGIYGIFRKSDDKCMYVGESKDVRNRIKHHLNGNTKNSFNKEEYYGDVIEEHMINDKQFRLEREAHWIEQLNPELNVIRDETKRGEYISGENSHMYGTHLSEETKKKIGVANSGENNPMYGKTGENSPLYGKHRAEETRKKIGAGVSGNKNGMYGKTGEKNPMYGKNPEDFMTPDAIIEKRKKQSESLKGKHVGKKWINNGVTNKRVKPDELHLYLENGWKFGRIKWT